MSLAWPYERALAKGRFPGVRGRHSLFHGHQLAPRNQICLGAAAQHSPHSLQGWRGYDKTEDQTQCSEITWLHCTCSDPPRPPWSFGYLANASGRPGSCPQVSAVSQAETDFPWTSSRRCSLKKTSKWVCELNSHWTELIINDADGAVQMIRTAPDVSWSKASLNHFRHTNGFPLLITNWHFSHRYKSSACRQDLL